MGESKRRKMAESHLAIYQEAEIHRIVDLSIFNHEAPFNLWHAAILGSAFHPRPERSREWYHDEYVMGATGFVVFDRLMNEVATGATLQEALAKAGLPDREADIETLDGFDAIVTRRGEPVRVSVTGGFPYLAVNGEALRDPHLFCVGKIRTIQGASITADLPLAVQTMIAAVAPERALPAPAGAVGSHLAHLQALRDMAWDPRHATPSTRSHDSFVDAQASTEVLARLGEMDVGEFAMAYHILSEDIGEVYDDIRERAYTGPAEVEFLSVTLTTPKGAFVESRRDSPEEEDKNLHELVGAVLKAVGEAEGKLMPAPSVIGYADQSPGSACFVLDDTNAFAEAADEGYQDHTEFGDCLLAKKGSTWMMRLINSGDGPSGVAIWS